MRPGQLLGVVLLGALVNLPMVHGALRADVDVPTPLVVVTLVVDACLATMVLLGVVAGRGSGRDDHRDEDGAGTLGP